MTKLALPRSVCAALAIALAGWAALTAQADILVLASGGQLEGQWLNREEQPATHYAFRRAGVTVELPTDQVREAIRQSPVELEYGRRFPAAADTVEAQWELAEWCRKSALASQRTVHLRRILELAPNHQQSRQALGYMYLKGQWITRSDSRRQEGYELYRGKWRTPQEIEILESRSRNELAEKEWIVRLKRWRRDLDDPDRHRLAYESLLKIRDPIAVSPLGEFFVSERSRQVKSLYADILARINTSHSVRILVDRTLSDPDEEVFHYCLGTLAELRPPRIGDAFISALADASNSKVNRGATALARLQDKSAISPLIDALTTTHTQVVRQGLGADATTTGFSSDGTFMKRGDGPEVQVYHVQNQPVLDALSKLTGTNFGFDEQSWRYWYAQDKIAREAAQPAFDARRQ
jgi:hypothetical protein